MLCSYSDGSGASTWNPAIKFVLKIDGGKILYWRPLKKHDKIPLHLIEVMSARERRNITQAPVHLSFFVSVLRNSKIVIYIVTSTWAYLPKKISSFSKNGAIFILSVTKDSLERVPVETKKKIHGRQCGSSNLDLLML